jgi:hypothetical protein
MGAGRVRTGVARACTLQLRFGPDIRLTAYQERLAAGAWYRAKQRFTPGALDSHVERTVQELALRMKNVTEPAWPLSWAHGLSSLVASEVEDFLAPSDGLYSRYALASYLRLAAACGGTGSAWRFIAFNALCLVGFWLVGKKLVLERWVLPNARATWLKVVGGLLTATGLLGTLLTGMAALSLLSRGRLEDQLALDALGLTFLSGLAFEDQLYARSGGLLLAIPGALAGLIDECMKLFDANSDPNRVVLGVPYKWLGWACALYLLPMALAVPTTLVLVWSIAGQIKKKVDEAERRRKAPPQSEFG